MLQTAKLVRGHRRRKALKVGRAEHRLPLAVAGISAIAALLGSALGNWGASSIARNQARHDDQLKVRSDRRGACASALKLINHQLSGLNDEFTSIAFYKDEQRFNRTLDVMNSLGKQGDDATVPIYLTGSDSEIRGLQKVVSTVNDAELRLLRLLQAWSQKHGFTGEQNAARQGVEAAQSARNDFAAACRNDLTMY